MVSAPAALTSIGKDWAKVIAYPDGFEPYVEGWQADTGIHEPEHLGSYRVLMSECFSGWTARLLVDTLKLAPEGFRKRVTLAEGHHADPTQALHMLSLDCWPAMRSHLSGWVD